MTGRQLHLFRGKRQRGSRVDYSPSEFAMHCAVADTLARWLAPGWVFNHIPLGEKRSPATGARLKRMGTRAGWPDLILLAPVGHMISRPFFLELKARGNGLTESQASFALWAKINCCPFEIADTYETAVVILKAWGAVRDGVNVQ